MGRWLEAFEERMGVALLQKTPGGFVLTPAGETVLGHVERIEQEALPVERTITGPTAGWRVPSGSPRPRRWRWTF